MLLLFLCVVKKKALGERVENVGAEAMWEGVGESAEGVRGRNTMGQRMIQDELVEDAE